MAKHNLAYQMDSAIQQAFRPGADKRSGKHTGEHKSIVYSFNEKKSLQQVAYEFKDYIKDNYSNIKLVKDLNFDHWQSFLNEKSKTCSTATLKNYVSRIGKIEIVCQNKFGFKSNWKENILAPSSQKTPGRNKLRVQQMDKSDLSRALEFGYINSKSKGTVAIDLCYRFGLRASECANLAVKDADLKNDQLHVKGKGGRHRYLPIRKEDYEILYKLCEGKSGQDN